jgi:hypothetical protein
MFVCAKEICKVFDEVFKVKNFMILIQDGPSADHFQNRVKQGGKNNGFCLQVLPKEEKLVQSKNAENAL